MLEQQAVKKWFTNHNPTPWHIEKISRNFYACMLMICWFKFHIARNQCEPLISPIKYTQNLEYNASHYTLTRRYACVRTCLYACWLVCIHALWIFGRYRACSERACSGHASITSRNNEGMQECKHSGMRKACKKSWNYMLQLWNNGMLTCCHTCTCACVGVWRLKWRNILACIMRSPVWFIHILYTHIYIHIYIYIRDAH